MLFDTVVEVIVTVEADMYKPPPLVNVLSELRAELPETVIKFMVTIEETDVYKPPPA